MSRKYTYHRENCDCFIREIIVDVYGRRVVLGGQHAFEYSITVISITGRTVVTNFKNGKEARKEFYKYKKKEMMDLFIYLLVGLPLSLLFLYIIFDVVNGDNK